MDPPEDLPGGGEGQPDGAPGQAGHGGGGECHGQEEEELAEDGGAEDEDGDGLTDWLAATTGQQLIRRGRFWGR